MIFKDYITLNYFKIPLVYFFIFKDFNLKLLQILTFKFITQYLDFLKKVWF